jgi:hypothetical protein
MGKLFVGGSITLMRTIVVGYHGISYISGPQIEIIDFLRPIFIA